MGVGRGGESNVRSRRAASVMVAVGVMLAMPAGALADSSPEKPVLPKVLHGGVSTTNQTAGFTDPLGGGAQTVVSPAVETGTMKDLKLELDPTAKEPGLYKVVGGTGTVTGSFTQVTTGQGVTNRTCTTIDATAPGGIKTPGNDLNLSPDTNGAKVHWDPTIPWTQSNSCGGPVEGGQFGYRGTPPPAKLTVTDEKNGDQQWKLNLNESTPGNPYSETMTGKVTGTSTVSYWGGFCITLRDEPDGRLHGSDPRAFTSNAQGEQLAHDIQNQAGACGVKAPLIFDGLPRSIVDPGGTKTLRSKRSPKILSVTGSISPNSMRITNIVARGGTAEVPNNREVVTKPFTIPIYQADNVEPHTSS